MFFDCSGAWRKSDKSFHPGKTAFIEITTPFGVVISMVDSKEFESWTSGMQGQNSNFFRQFIETAAYLLLFRELPTADQLQDFCGQLASYRTLPTNFFQDVIMKAPPKDLMNTMQRGILTLFCYDDKPNDISLENVLRQSLQLMSNMPVLAIYAYQAWRYSNGESLFIHVPKPELSTAENFLRMLREDRSYTELEARTLDVALVLHADNGGGNNSTFTNHVVTSSGTDTYSAIAAAMASLKGPRHGGANSKVMAMMDDIKENVRDWNDDCVADYLTRMPSNGERAAVRPFGRLRLSWYFCPFLFGNTILETL